MKKFIKENWFKIAIIIILLVVASAYALGQYAYYQKQQTQIQLLNKEEQKELKLKEEFYPMFLKIQEVKKRSQEEADQMVNDLSEEEWRIYELLKYKIF